MPTCHLGSDFLTWPPNWTLRANSEGGQCFLNRHRPCSERFGWPSVTSSQCLLLLAAWYHCHQEEGQGFFLWWHELSAVGATKAVLVECWCHYLDARIPVGGATICPLCNEEKTSHLQQIYLKKIPHFVGHPSFCLSRLEVRLNWMSLFTIEEGGSENILMPSQGILESSPENYPFLFSSRIGKGWGCILFLIIKGRCRWTWSHWCHRLKCLLYRSLKYLVVHCLPLEHIHTITSF